MGLTASQWQFIARRLVSGTDVEAAEAIGVRRQTISEWKQIPEFLAEYEAAFKDGVHVALEITRQNLGKAAMVLTDGLEANKSDRADYQTRINSAKTIFQAHGLCKQTSELKADVNISGGLRIDIGGDGAIEPGN